MSKRAPKDPTPVQRAQAALENELALLKAAEQKLAASRESVASARNALLEAHLEHDASRPQCRMVIERLTAERKVKLETTR